MVITAQTTVKEAVDSCEGAAQAFEKRGIIPREKCSGMYDMVTLEDAVEWCKVGELESLIAELNAAIRKEA